MRNFVIIPIGFLTTAPFASAQSDNAQVLRKPELPEVQAFWATY